MNLKEDVNMKKTNRQLKRYAREAFQLKPGMAIGASLTVVAIQFASPVITGMLIPATGTLSIILGEIFSFALTVLICLFEAGMYYMLLNLSRGKESYYGQLLWFFTNDPDRIILASAIMALITWLTSLPSTVYSYTAPLPTTQEELINYYLMMTAVSFACLCVGILITIPLRLTYYLLADEPELTSIEALKKSVLLMKGNCIRFLLLQLSFLPWALISAFAMYIPFLYVLPYMELSNVAFYRDIRGEYILYHPPEETQEQMQDIVTRQ